MGGSEAAKGMSGSGPVPQRTGLGSNSNSSERIQAKHLLLHQGLCKPLESVRPKATRCNSPQSEN